MNAIKTEKVNIKSVLSVDFNISPRVSQIGKTVKFTADSPRAQYYEWDFKD
jgi:PKD repeat protein